VTDEQILDVLDTIPLSVMAKSPDFLAALRAKGLDIVEREARP
jgi:hypothetical protein